MKPILIREDKEDGYIYACPYCHRYVNCSQGLHRCYKCGGEVDNDHYETVPQNLRVVFDGKPSWREE